MDTRALHLIVIASLAASCGVDSIATTGRTPDLDSTESTKQKEAWAAQDAPSIFTSQLEYRIDALPMSGEAANIPWAGSYWPTYQDNINFKWGGANTDSPAKKYERAFYPDGGTKVEDLVSRYHGIDSVQKSCQAETDCSSEFGEVCARRDGADAGRCVATWWGICHAWAPASILLPEPRYPVTKNGITFQPQDLKALGSLVYNNTTSKFVSLRCNKQNSLPDGGGIQYDEYGRPTDAHRECRDTNAGTYHVLLANYLGIQKQSFVEDRTYNYEVWNQPLRSYSITQKLEVSANDAHRLIGAAAVLPTDGGAITYRFNPNAKRFFHVKLSVQYISESGSDDGYTAPNISWYTKTDRYEYVLETDAEGKILGGEWLGSSKQNHPDFLWLPTGVGSQTVAGGSIKYSVVRDLVLESAGLAPDAGTPRTGLPVDTTEGAAVAKDEWKHFGPYATTVGSITVEMTGTGDADLYVRMGGQPTASVYDCRPYTGSSNESCTLSGPGPLYVSVHGYAAGNVSIRIRYTSANAGPVVDAGTPVVDAGTPVVVDAGTPVVDAGTPVVVDAGTPSIPADATYDAGVAASAWKHFGPWNAGAGTVQIDMTGTGDGDLYVRKGSAPTDTAYDCRPYKSGSAESCTVSGPGLIYVSVKGYTAAQVSVRVRFTAGTTPTPATHLDVTGTVATNELKVFQVPVTAGRKIVLRTTAPNDVDLYVKLGAAPTTAAYDARGYTNSGNETVSFTPATSGTLYVGVHGYAASSFTLKSADQ